MPIIAFEDSAFISSIVSAVLSIISNSFFNSFNDATSNGVHTDQEFLSNILSANSVK